MKVAELFKDRSTGEEFLLNHGDRRLYKLFSTVGQYGSVVWEAEGLSKESGDRKPIGDASDHGGLRYEHEPFDENVVGEDHAATDGGEERKRGAKQNLVGGIPFRH